MAQPALSVDRLDESRRHVHEFHVRFGDIDVLGHVNNCRYFTYLEDARIGMFRLDPMREGREPLKVSSSPGMRSTTSVRCCSGPTPFVLRPG